MDTQQEFFDQHFSDSHRQSADEFYAIVGAVQDWLRRELRAHVAGKRVLECGCGPGTFALYCAENGAAHVVGIDLSPVGIEMAAQSAKDRSLNNVEFLVADLAALDFEDGYFDVICGSGILHHLDLPGVLPEIVRVLADSGRAVFIEPMGYNPAINLYRRLTPRYRVPGEHPLKMADFKQIERHFEQVDYQFYYLLTILAMVFRRSSAFNWIVELLHAADQSLFRVLPWFRFLAWQVTISGQRPIRRSAQ